MEDLVEEIVGEIHDETEKDNDKIIEESKGVFIVPGSIELSRPRREDWRIPLVANTDCTTVAGAVVELFGRLPARWREDRAWQGSRSRSSMPTAAVFNASV